jgi:hypothetical protein
MTADCCAVNPDKPRKLRCPANGIEYAEVPARTVSHHIRQAWQWADRGRRYFYCDAPGCDIVYFSDDGIVIPTAQLRSVIGVKTPSGHAPLCYCFGISKADALNEPGIRDFVVEQTRCGLCSCDTSNPSGKCCLKDFPRSGNKT